MKPLVSVIIPNYNYARYVRDAVDSVLAQTYPYIEIIVVDDGSKDGSQAVIESYGDKITPLFQENQGVSAARNNGIEVASGEYIAFLDSDDLWSPLKVEMQVEAFIDNAELGMVHVGVVEIDDEGRHLSEIKNGKDGWVSSDLLLLSEPVILGGGSGIMVSRKVWEDIGGFDCKMSTSADWDFFYRASVRSKVGFVPSPLLFYRTHGSNMHGNIEAMEHDVTLCFEKAFSGKTNVSKNECYGNMHKVLAGSYFKAGQYLGFVRNLLKSVWYRPSILAYYLTKPFIRRREN